MAEILPFRAWRYNQDLTHNIQELTSPLFDVINDQQSEALYNIALNSIHLSVPKPQEAPSDAKSTIERWKKDGVILQDELPGIYVYYQKFTLPGNTQQLTRKGFICMIKAEDWGKTDSDILRHENTIPHSVDGRVAVLDATEFNVSPTHGLYRDQEFELEAYMDEAMKSPVYEVEDYQGVVDSLAIIHDHEVIKKFIKKLSPQQVILADGHHRLESSIQYRNLRKEQNQEHSGKEGYNYHLMYLTNGASQDLRILPTHRLIQGLAGFDKEELLSKLSQYFIIKELDDPYDIQEIILGKQWAFGLLFGEEVYKIRLKPEVHEQLDWNFPPLLKDLDLTVMHYFVIEKCLGIPGKEQRRSPNISFERNFTLCVKKTIKGEAQCALITKEIDMDTVQKVCRSGYTLPQKSTFFYPKVVSGFLFASIKEDEFSLPFDPSF